MSARNANRSSTPLGATFCLLAALTLTTGCGGTKWLQLAGLGKDDIPRAGDKNPVVKIVTMWQPTDGLGPDNRSTRGFAGRIMFITREKALPSLCDGQVDIFVFDDVGEMNDQQKPLHHFQFPAEQWRQLALQHPALGVSYGVFIPYTRKGTHKAECSLRVMHTAPNGVVAYSDFGKVTLEGSSDKATNPTADISKVEKMSLGTGSSATAITSTTTEVVPGANNSLSTNPGLAANNATVSTVASVSAQGATLPPGHSMQPGRVAAPVNAAPPIRMASAQSTNGLPSVTQAALKDSVIDSSGRYRTHVNYGPEPSVIAEKTVVEPLVIAPTPNHPEATHGPAINAAIDAAIARARSRTPATEPAPHPLNSSGPSSSGGATHPLMRTPHPRNNSGGRGPAHKASSANTPGRHPLATDTEPPEASGEQNTPPEPKRHPLSLKPRRILASESVEPTSQFAVNSPGNPNGIR
jgi:hypothetical protein